MDTKDEYLEGILNRNKKEPPKSNYFIVTFKTTMSKEQLHEVLCQHLHERDEFDSSNTREVFDAGERHIIEDIGWPLQTYHITLAEGSEDGKLAVIDRACDTDAYRDLVQRLHVKYYRDDLPGDDYPPEYWTEFNEEFDLIKASVG